MTLLALRLLGGFAAEVRGAPFDAFATDKVRALLAYLALESPQAQRRAHLATLFWPDWDERSALANLRKSLFRLRQALEAAAPGLAGQALEITHHTVAFRAGAAEVDALTFQSLLAESDAHAHAGLERCPTCRERLVWAADLYRGDLLAGLSVPAARPFEEWLTVRQERLHRQALDLLHLLTSAYQHEGAHETAIAYANRQLALEPWRESAHRRLMTLLALTGEEEQAIRQYDKCRQILDEELGVLPSAETERLLQEISRSRGRVTAPAASVGMRLHGFPAQATTFLGRGGEIDILLDRLRNPDVRLLTLTGYGGSGKTSLAVRAATRFASEGIFPGDAWFIPLTTVANPALLATTVGAHLGLSFEAEHEPEQQVIDFLKLAPALLVLDNYEQLLPDSRLVQRILREAPQTTMLITSRAPLDLRAEWRVPIEGLTIPAAESSLDALRSNESAQLMVTIARQLEPRFGIDDDNGAAIARICRRLDGLPLALEIAANWLDIYSPNELAAQLDAGLGLPAATRRDTPDRHRSLQIVFNHSWALLNSIERTTLARLTCFQSHFSPAAARAVTGASAGVLHTLLNHALLRRYAGSRYGLHPVLREYAGEKLDQAEITYRLHAGWFLRRVADRSTMFSTLEAAAAIALIDETLDDIRQAWQWAIDNRHMVWLGLGLDGLAAYYEYKGLYHEGRDALSAAAIAAQEMGEGTLAGRLWLAEAAFRLKLGERKQALSSAEMVRDMADEATLTAALLLLGRIHEHSGDYEAAIAILEQAMRRLEAQGDSPDLAEGLGQIAHLHRQRNAYDRSIPVYKQALAVNRRLDNLPGMAGDHAGLGLAYKDMGEYEAAIDHLAKAREIAIALGHRELVARFTQNVGLVYWQMDRLDEALVYYQEALSIAESINHLRGMSICLSTIGILHRRRYQYDEALTHYRRAKNLMEQIGDQANLSMVLGNMGNLYMDLGQFEQAEAYHQRALAIDRQLGVTEGVARHLGNIGDALKIQGRWYEARPFFEEGIPMLRGINGRYYLCWQLVSLAEVLFMLEEKEAAAALAAEGKVLAEKVDRRQYHFEAALLEARMAAAHDTEGPVVLPVSIYERYDLPEERAQIAFTTWQLAPTEDNRGEALRSAEAMLAESGVYRYRRMLEQLRPSPEIAVGDEGAHTDATHIEMTQTD
ncbi:MAG: tetratricopeptide repeat protein [Chloroflexota bacterium]